MRAYLTMVRLRFLLLLQYRATVFANVVTQSFFGIVRIMVFDAFYRSNATAAPMAFRALVTYQWLNQALLTLLPWSGDNEVQEMVRSGNVAYELCRPVNIYGLWYSRCLALQAAPTIIRAIPVFVVGAIILPVEYRLRLPETASAGLAWLISTLGSLVLAAAFANIYNIVVLWTVSGLGISRMLPSVINLFCGTIIPIAFFPDWLQPLLRFLPFAGLVDTPLRFYLGLLPFAALPGALFHQLAWTAVLVLLGHWLLSRQLRRVVVQGG